VGESYSEIAKSEKKSNDTIRKAVKKTADFLGIERRPTPPGRHPKKKPA
jgi:transposase